MRLSLRAALLCAALAPVSLAQAQEAPEPAPAAPATPGSDDFHDRIVVTAAGLGTLDLLAGTSVMSGTELQRSLDGQLGEVLAKLPGVTASGFAPGVSRPILRGFGGERVRVLTDGVGALDASSTSDDHAVTVDPLVAERIEVLRGPAVLLYGSQAIGGAVNVTTKRIPPGVPDEPIHIDATLAGDTVADRREGGLSLDLPLGPRVAFHLDGSYRDTGNVEIPGFVASPTLRAALLEAADEEDEEGHADEAAELREGANTRGVLPNSWTETYTLGTGIAVFGDKASFGLSYDYYDTSYGIPGLPGVGHVHDHDESGEEGEEHEEEGPVSIGMKRHRADLRGAVEIGGFLEKIQTRWAWSDYTHTEFEGGEVGTVFDISGIEGRLELIQAPRGNWRGSFGGQFAQVDFSATGEEAFVPSNKTQSAALFALQEVDLDPVGLQLGARFEHTAIDAASVGAKRTFDTFSAAAGLSYDLPRNLRAGINLSRAERAPVAQELLADGPHVATQQYEIGSLALDKEGSWGVEGYVRGDIGPAQLSFSAYRNWFDGFIYLSDTGTEQDGLPAFEFLQQDADQWGLEGEISLPLYRRGEFGVKADLRGAYVRATLADGSPVPRIPPLSVLGALDVHWRHLEARGEVQHFARADRLAALETPTPGFTLVNLALTWHPIEGKDNLTLVAQADNLFDQEGRRHTSVTKDFVPLPGRNFKLSARLSL